MPTISPRQTLSDLRHCRFSSAPARRLLSLVYREGAIYTVPFGQIRGVRLQYDPTVNFQMMLGLWEMESFNLLARICGAGVLPSESPVFCDVGANLGLYTLFFARQRLASTVYAFEPGPVAERLRTNVQLNRLSNVVVVEQACSDSMGEVEFYLGHQHYTSSLHADWDQGDRESAQVIRVPTTTLDGFFYGVQPRPGPDLIKMDIEGGGTRALKECDQCIQDKRPLFLIESHTPDEDRAISDLVLRHNYRAFRLNDHRWVSAPNQTHPDPNGIWGTLLLWPTEKQSMAERVVVP
jgi:FkbM family methyltransferase